MTFSRWKFAFVLVLLAGIAAVALSKVNAVRREQEHAEAVKYLRMRQQNAHWKEEARRFDKEKAAAATVFAQADRVQVFRLYPTGNKETARGKLRGGVPYFAEATSQTGVFARRLGAVVLDPSSYELPGDSTKQCYIDPGVGFRVWSGQRFVDVVLCFECSVLVVLEDRPNLPVRHIGGWIEGRFAVAGDFDSVRPALVALAKEALPGERVIQRL